MLTWSRQCIRVFRDMPLAASTIWMTLRTPVMPNQIKVPNQARNHQSWVYRKEIKAGTKPSITFRTLPTPLFR